MNESYGVVMKCIKPILCFLALGMVFLNGCAPIVKENTKAAEKMANHTTIHWRAESYPYEVETINSEGNRETQVFHKPPERVVAVWQNSIETLLALGVGDRIIVGMGVPNGQYIHEDYRQAYEAIPYKSLENLDLETIMMFNPDFIIGWSSTFSKKVLRSTDFWHSRGIHTYISPNSTRLFPQKTIENEYDDIMKLGHIFDRQERAKELLSQMEGEIQKNVDQAKSLSRKPRALIIELMGQNIHVYGRKTLAGNILERMEGELLVSEQVEISKEQIIELSPDVIFVVITEDSYSQPERVLNRLYEEKALRDVPCIKAKQVHVLPLYSIYASGTRTLEGIQRIGRGLYPQLP